MNHWQNDIESEVHLSPAEEAELERMLESDDYKTIASELRALKPLRAPEGIARSFDRQMVRNSRLRVATTFATGVAACFALFAALYHPTVDEAPKSSAAGASLYDWHYEAVATSVLPGDGANLAGFSQVAGKETEAR